MRAEQVPTELYVDNGLEFVSRGLDEWTHRREVKLTSSCPGTPTDDAFIEPFNVRLRSECLNQN